MDADVIVIGAGLAGLTCAREVQGAGLAVAVLEAADAVGGRVRTDVVDGFRCDRGFQVLNPAYPAVRRHVDLAALRLQQFAPGALVRDHSGLHALADPVRGARYLSSTLRSGYLSPRDLAGLAAWMAPMMANPQKAMRSEDASLATALDESGVTGRLRTVIDRFLAGVLVDSAGETSANLARVLLRSFALGRPGLPRGGMQDLPEQLREPLRDVRLQTRVHDIQEHDDRVTVTTDHGQVSGRVAVIATDPVTASALTPLPQPAMKGLVTWWFEAPTPPDTRPMLALDARGGEAPPGPVWNAAVISAAAPTYAPTGRHLVEATTLLDRPDGDADEAIVKRHVAEIYGCDTSAWQVVTRHRIPHALPATPPPLQVRSDLMVGARLVVCGDHRDTASIQGALVSGGRAAQQVLRTLVRTAGHGSTTEGSS